MSHIDLIKAIVFRAVKEIEEIECDKEQFELERLLAEQLHDVACRVRNSADLPKSWEDLELEKKLEIDE